MPDPRDLLICLLDYIKEQAKQINPAAYRLANAKGFQRQRGDIAGLPGVEFDIKVAGDHIWLRIPRLVAEPPPAPQPAHKVLLRFSPDPNGPPPSIDEGALARQINLRVQSAKPRGEPVDIAQFEAQQKAAAAMALSAYTALWTTWAIGERPRRRTIALYGDLFTLMHQMEAEQTSKPQELIWGIGISSWQLRTEKENIAFEYPLLTQAMELSIDDQSMAIEIRPRATETQVELDAFVACQVSGTIEVERSAIAQLSRLKDRPTTPFDPGSYSDVLKLIAGNLDSEGQYKEVLTQNGAPPMASSHLVVTDAWVLLSRPRTINYLFEDLKRLQEKLEEGCTIHEGPLALVTAPSDLPIQFEPITFRGLSGRGTSTASGTVEELYFPLPYNDEQVTIVQRLKRAPGVTVQGPPGTGKTHTIANVICHYLASGKRVLVTSRGEAALSVLQDKIPEEVRALTVALLTSDREGIRQFQGSIEAIQHKVSQINPELTRQEIERLRGSIDRAHSELITIDRRIDQIAQQQLSAIEVDGAEIRAQSLAELVVSGRDRYGWFDDEITLGPLHAPPLSSDEASRLRGARRALGEDIVYVTSRVPSADSFPSPATLCDLHDVLVKRGSIEEEVRSGELTPLKANTPEVFEAARGLVELIEEMIALTGELQDVGESWPFELRKRCGHASFASERSALESLFEDLDALVEARAQFLKFPVIFPSEALQDGKTAEAVSRAVETGKPFGFLSLGSGDAKEYIAEVRVQGRAPANRDDWQKVKEWIALHEQVLTFETRWNALHELLSVPALAGGVTSLRQLEVVALSARRAHRLATHFDLQFGKRASEVFDNGFEAKTRTGRSDLEEIRKELSQHLVFASLSSAAIELSDIQEKLAGKSGPVSDALRRFARDTLGNEQMARERIGAQYAELIEELRRIASLASQLSCVTDEANRLEAAGAPKLAARVRSVPVAASGEDSTFPTTWRDAWNWSRVRTHLDQIEAREDLLTLARRRREVEDGLARFYQEMVARAAWLATKQNATPRVLQALAGYATAVRRIGQGTGPNATRYRRDARQMMYDAAGAVPCWIMNHSRISEAMPADIGAFDLVIVDEASQSDLWALPAILRGKRILVVGDDKQVSPDGGFIESTRIQELLDRFLTEQPFAAEMTPEKSLYDLAARVFAADQVMLREHFRCVPPIIAYSNRTFYQNQILPLRIARASERIEPPLVDIYVEGGMRDAHDRNVYEAQAIADEISAVLANEKLAYRTIGVVSLLGSDQAKHIDSVVTQRCDAAELRRRKFLCGDARAFQGSERHIMFLSMVADPRNCKALSGSMFDQRFNVAASRAQDRMYLVRSVVASDLSDKDIRASLLSHFDKPMVLNTEDTTKLIDLCESGFERDVYTEFTRRDDTQKCCQLSGFLGADGDFEMFSYDLYLHLKKSAPEFEQLAAVETEEPQFSVKQTNTLAKPLNGLYVSGNYFAALQTIPYLGRVLTESDDTAAAPPVIVLSYNAWKREFASDRSTIGSRVFIQTHPFVVIGVAPPGFFGDRIAEDAPAFWVPLASEPLLAGAGSLLHDGGTHWLYTIGRLRPGTSLGPLQTRLSGTLQQWLAARPEHANSEDKAKLPKQHVVIVPAARGIRQMAERYDVPLRTLMLLSTMVLLIACANIANLLLVRIVARRTNLSVCVALGAPRGRIIRQMFTDSLLLSLIGGVLGLGLAFISSYLFLRLTFSGSTDLPIQASPSAPILAFALLVSIGSGVLFGTAPARLSLRVQPAEVLRGFNASTPSQSSLPQRILVTLQAALSLVLLAGALLTARSLYNLGHQDLVIETENLYVLHLDLDSAGYGPQRRPALYSQIRTQFSALGGVTGVGLTGYSFLEFWNWWECDGPLGTPKPHDLDSCNSTVDTVSPRYLDIIGVPVLRGREFSDQDTATSTPVAIINESFAHHFFPNQDPLGKRFNSYNESNAPDVYEIVGVFKDFKTHSPENPVKPVNLRPISQRKGGGAGFINSVVIRFNRRPEDVDGMLRRTLARIDPNILVTDLRTMDSQISGTLGKQKLIARLAVAFGGLALALAAVGLYGVTSYIVVQRTGEIGIRIALGSSRLGIIRLVLRSVLLLTGLGLALGIPCALVVGYFIRDQLYELHWYDPVALIGSAAVLTMCAGAAAFIPARRAASIQPMTALRTE